MVSLRAAPGTPRAAHPARCSAVALGAGLRGGADCRTPLGLSSPLASARATVSLTPSSVDRLSSARLSTFGTNDSPQAPPAKCWAPRRDALRVLGVACLREIFSNTKQL